MTSRVYVPRDYAGIQRHLPAFLKLATESERQRQRRIQTRRPAQALPPAYEAWMAYLAEADQLCEVLKLEQMDEETVRGVLLLRAARERFLLEHEKCPACASLNARGAMFCPACGCMLRKA